MAQVPDEDEVPKKESLPNTNPVLLPENLPAGFTLQESRIERTHRPNRTRDTIYEIWVKGPSPGNTQSSFVKISLYLEKSRAAALETASAVYGATQEANQSVAIGKPRLGSYTGQLIGDFCWFFRSDFKRADTGLSASSIRTASSLVVVEKDNCFDILYSIPSDSGQSIDDTDTEKIAKKLVHRLKTWPRPQ